MKHLTTLAAVLALAACSQPASQNTAAEDAGPAAAVAPPVTPDVPAGAYTLDKSHASIAFRVNHLGFSRYTAQFDKFDAKLQFDPANPSASQVEATIDVNSLALPSPPPGFTKEILGSNWLDGGKHPQMTFKSTGVEVTGANTAKITGDLTLHGVTKPVTLDATFNGGHRGNQMDPKARIGFSAEGKFNRSDFGIAAGIPAPGSTMGVSDEVDVMIEAEFSGPPMAATPAT